MLLYGTKCVVLSPRFATIDPSVITRGVNCRGVNCRGVNCRGTNLTMPAVCSHHLQRG